MIETLKKAIETDDAEYLLEYLSDVYTTALNENYEQDTIQENMYIAYKHVYTTLKEIADKNGIKPLNLPLIDEIKAKIEQIKLEFKQHKDYNQLQEGYEEALEMSRQYIADFIPFAEELKEVFRNPELIDRKQELIDIWAYDDKNFPLETPQIVQSYDEEGWPIEGSEHLETEDEVNKRITDELKYREKTIAEYLFVNRDTFIKWYQFICNIKELAKLNSQMIENKNKVYDKVQEIKLQEFKSDTEFYDELLKIMDHDKKKELYWYHGTQDVDSAYSIIKQGLVLAENDLTTTAYREFKPDQLLLYSRGFGGEIGSDAVVIFKQPRTENGEFIDIIKKNNKKLKVVQSGLGFFRDRLDYIIPKEHMVGIVNKRDHKIIYANELTDKQDLTL